jgi:hypothetical protein
MPPNPRWGRNRRTGRPTKPENKIGREYNKRRQEQRKRDAEQAALEPPPRLDEVVRGPSLVPPPQVRFATQQEAPQPERVVGGTSSVAERHTSTVEAAGSIPVSRSNPIVEPDDGVPVRINDDGSIELIEGDGSILPEEDGDGNDAE